MSFILVIGGALMPRQGYEQCEGGHPIFVKTQEYISNKWWNFPK